jgi:hypothetical protein
MATEVLINHRGVMYTRIFLSTIALAATMSAQNGQYQRRAVMSGGGSPDRGKCTIEVVVDGAAEVEIRGDSATLRDVSGQPPQWRRFECTGPMPANPPNFAFQGIDGRGRQDLVRDPRNGGSAVVRIEDPQGGAQGYTFDLTWNTGNGYPGGQDPNRGYPGTQAPNRAGQPPNPGWQDPNRGNPNNNGWRDGGRPLNGQFSKDDAVRACQDAVRQQSRDRFQTSNITFRETNWDDNPGRNDWVLGTFAVRRDYGREETYRFSCSVNFDNSQVRSAQIEPMDGGRYAPGAGLGDRGRAIDVNSPAIQNCERAAAQRIRSSGYQRVEFGRVRVEDRPGASDWVVGDATADGRYRSGSFTFSCSVNLQSAIVRSVNVKTR